MNKMLMPYFAGVLLLLATALWVWPAGLMAGPVRVTSDGIEFSDGTKQASSLTGKWRKRLPAKERFKPALAWNGAGLEECPAILDRETGLIWEKSPDPALRTWEEARTYCYQKTLGDRKGWRLPTVDELASLVDTEHLSPCIPEGAPFSGVRAYFYWSATSNDDDNAWYVVFAAGYIGKGPKEKESHAWCVRGGD